MVVYRAYYESPIGFIEIKSNRTHIKRCDFVEEKGETTEIPEILEKTIFQISEYFEKKRTKFDLDLRTGGTNFQQRVWSELQKIPFGETITYQQLAARIGYETASRAVGNANGKNPISIIIPCHRVIGSDGKLIGYGGGLKKKKWLIDFEKA